MFETLSSPLTASSAPLPAAPPAPRRRPTVESLPTLRPLSGRAFLFFAFIYLYSFPYFDRLRSANEMPRILMSQEIVERGSCRIDGRMNEMGSRFDLSKGADGHFYSNKAPGPSFLAVPVYAVLKFFKTTSIRSSTWAFRVFAVTIPALFFLPFFYRLTARFTPDEPARRATLVAYALGSSALPYAILFLSHQLAAVCLGSAFVAAVLLARDETARPRLTALLVGALCAAAVLMDYQTVFVAPVVGLYAFIRARKRLRNLAFIALGALPLAVALGLYHKLLFGSPLATPLSTANDTVTRTGFLGMVGPSRQSFFLLLLDPSNGLVLLMPWVLLALVGLVAIFASRTARRRAGAEAITCLVIVAVYLVAIGSLVPQFARAGWAVGPRYLGACFPFLGWLAAAGFAAAYRFLVTRVLAQAVVLVSVAIFLAAATTFPHWPDGLRNPVFELSFRLVREGYATHSVGTALGLRGFLALAPLYLVALGVVLWLISRGTRLAPLAVPLACALAVGVFYVYQREFPATGPYAEHAWRYVTRIWEPPPGPKLPWPAALTPAPPPPAVVKPVVPAVKPVAVPAPAPPARPGAAPGAPAGPRAPPVAPVRPGSAPAPVRPGGAAVPGGPGAVPVAPPRPGGPPAANRKNAPATGQPSGAARPGAPRKIVPGAGPARQRIERERRQQRLRQRRQQQAAPARDLPT